MAALTLAALLTGAAWWQVPTDSDTTAEVRAVFVDRLVEHRQDVRHKAHLADLRRLAEAAAAAAQEAQDALNAAPVAPTASDYSGCLTSAQVASYARSAGFPESVIPTMVAYAYRESHYCPGAINSSSGACGLYQLYPCYGGTAWLDPAVNSRLAYQKYQAAGLSPWGG